MFIRIHYKDGNKQKVENIISLINSDNQEELVYQQKGKNKEPVVIDKKQIDKVSAFHK